MDEKHAVSTIKKVMPAVVSIVITKHLEDVEREMPGGQLFPFVPSKVPLKKQQVPPEMVDAHGMVQVGGGSGFLVTSDGIVLTNKHVVSEANASYTVLTDDEKKYPARILCRDPINDVAILKIEEEGTTFPTIALGDATHLQLGMSVLAIGNALGIFKNTVSVGIVSGLSRSVTAQADPNQPPQELRGLIQTDAAINPGNSGGPLIDAHGRAVGINAAIISGAQNIGLALPINSAARDLSDLKKYGRIMRPYLGVRYVILDEMIQQKLKTKLDYGAYVTGETPHDAAVVQGSPAYEAGVRAKDIIIGCNGKKITRDYTIQDALDGLHVGDYFHMKILRGDHEIEVKSVLTERT